jgi:putative ABC transport system permease protein
MLVILLGSGKGLKNSIFKNVEGFATNSLFFFADRTGEPYRGFNKGRLWQMRNRDYETIKREVKGLEAISPIIWGNNSDKNIAFGQIAGTYNVKGVFHEYFKIEKPTLYFGRLMNDIDIRERRKVCMIGTRICEELFKNEDPCGKYIRVNGIYYQVIGVVKQIASGVNIGGRIEGTVFLPFTTMQQTLNQGDVLHFLCMSVIPGHNIQQVIDEVEGIMKRQNEISPSDPQAVIVMNLATQFVMFENLFTGIDLLIWIVGFGTLLAGIVGISNIMMVTVKERTREIGIRRAIGAKPWDIISQIMSESLVLTALAGLMGLSFGVFLLDLADKVMSANPAGNSAILHPGVNIGTAVAATALLLICGLFAGLIPAWRAMKIKAIDAIRDE